MNWTTLIALDVFDKLERSCSKFRFILNYISHNESFACSGYNVFGCCLFVLW